MSKNPQGFFIRRRSWEMPSLFMDVHNPAAQLGKALFKSAIINGDRCPRVGIAIGQRCIVVAADHHRVLTARPVYHLAFFIQPAPTVHDVAHRRRHIPDENRGMITGNKRHYKKKLSPALCRTAYVCFIKIVLTGFSDYLLLR